LGGLWASIKTSLNSIVCFGIEDTEIGRMEILNEIELFKNLDQRGMIYSILRPLLNALQQTLRKLIDAVLVVRPTGSALRKQI
jgi:hypothetical protein